LCCASLDIGQSSSSSSKEADGNSNCFWSIQPLHLMLWSVSVAGALHNTRELSGHAVEKRANSAGNSSVTPHDVGMVPLLTGRPVRACARA